MKLSIIYRSLVLAAFFRGESLTKNRWTSNSDQVLTLSLFFTGDISSSECQARFANCQYVGGLYESDGELNPLIKSRYEHLIALLDEQPHLIEGAGDFDTPADPTFTSCRLTDQGKQLISDIAETFPRKPDFPSWPDRNTDS